MDKTQNNSGKSGRFVFEKYVVLLQKFELLNT